MVAKAIMIQGTSSNAGKSTLATAICGLLRRKGVSVCPFKPQNMSLNSAVTIDNGEIGRAQAVQAQACSIEPRVDMNPILLKPDTAIGAQVIIQGHVVGHMDAAEYHLRKQEFMPYVLESYYRLTDQYECVVVEGAGSPAEINLRAGDIANMGFAMSVNCPVLLVADIDRGGVFAQIVGTMALLSPAERDLVRGFIINKFRGDVRLLDPGIAELEEMTGKLVLGVFPHMRDLYLEAEDSLSNQVSITHEAKDQGGLTVVVPRLPHVANQTDFDALFLNPQVELHLVGGNDAIPPCDLIILPGSKNVYLDLCWLNEHGWESAINRHLRYGGKVLGICGGFQMLGRRIHDPHGVESEIGSFEGLGLFDMETTLELSKCLKRRHGRLSFSNAEVAGYEIHMGNSGGPALKQPFIHLGDGTDGAISDDNLIVGTYLHGLFDHPDACAAIMSWAGLCKPAIIDYRSIRQDNIEKLVDVAADHLEQRRLDEIIFGHQLSGRSCQPVG